MSKVWVLALAALVLVSCVGVESEQNPAANQLMRNAKSGNAESQFEMAIRYMNGAGVKQDYAKAVRWLKLASAQDHHQAEFLLGTAYSTGRGLKVDRKEAVRLFTRAANAENARAQYQLGLAFANGRGVAKDMLWASRWYEKAARQKHTGALFSIGIMRAAGLDAIKDMEQAWVWLELATINGHAQAERARDKVATRLSSAALTRARKQVETWQWSATTSFDDIPTVRYTQRGLNKLGFLSGKENGIADWPTKAAIVAFRRSKNMGSTVAVDPELVTSIRKTLANIN
jgi:TPR repeat protein